MIAQAGIGAGGPRFGSMLVLGAGLVLGSLSLLAASATGDEETGNCWAELGGQACSKVPASPGPCPWDQYDNGDCPTVKSSTSGFSNSVAFTATCKYKAMQKDQNGVCQPVGDYRLFTAACKQTQGSVCGGGGGPYEP